MGKTGMRSCALASKSLIRSPHREAYWWSAFTSMSYGFLDRYSRHGNRQDLQEVIDIGLAAMQEPENRKFLNYEIQDNVAHAFLYKAHIDGSLENVKSALAIGYAGLKTNRNTGSVEYHGLVTGCLLVRYQITRESDDLEQGLYLAEQGLKKPHKTSYGMVTLLHNHASLPLAKHERYSQREDDHDISLLNQALTSVKDCLSLNNLWEAPYNLRGRIFSAIFAVTRQLEDGDKSIESLQKALELISRDHPSYLQFNTDMAHAYAEKFLRLDKSGSRQAKALVLENALVYATVVVEATDTNDTAFSERNNNLATLHVYKSIEQENPQVKDYHQSLAKDFFCRAANAPNSPPRARIDGAHKAGRFLLTHKEWKEADSVLDQAIKMLPKLASTSMTSQDQQEVLRVISGMATAAAEAALHVGRPAWESVQRLESARCLISETGMKQRDDLQILMEKHPSYATSYKALRNQIADHSRFRPMDAEYFESRDDQEQRLRELDVLEVEIRNLPGFERFLLPMSEGDLKALAQDGPIVAFNIGQERSDALIITPTGVTAIPLDVLDTREVRRSIEALSPAESSTQRNGSARKRASSHYTLKNRLLWLWNVAVEPAVKVALEDHKGTSTKRIWWLTSGLLGGAPFHLAGDQAGNSTLDYCVSSYISSCKALKYAREKAKTVDPEHRALLVTMPTSPSPYKPLSIAAEKTAVEQAFGNAHVIQERPCAADVADMLSEFSFVHLACHGVSIHQDPSRSGVILLEKHDVSEAAVLTVSTLQKLHLKVAYLAYLSACSTAEIGSGALRDESIHLTNCFQMIGFPHVIGTIWPADDSAAGEIARGFYRILFEEGHIIDSTSIASALHRSMSEYRKRENDVARWGPFVHVGA